MTRRLELINGVPRMQNDPASVAIYDQNYSVGSTITTGTPITLPSSGTYSSSELEVRLNGQKLSPVLDYNYVGSPPRTQVSFTFDLVNGDSINFRVDRTA